MIHDDGVEEQVGQDLKDVLEQHTIEAIVEQHTIEAIVEQHIIEAIVEQHIIEAIVEQHTIKAIVEHAKVPNKTMIVSKYSLSKRLQCLKLFFIIYIFF